MEKTSLITFKLASENGLSILLLRCTLFTSLTSVLLSIITSVVDSLTDDDKKLSGGAIAGILLGSLMFLIIITGLLIWYRKFRRGIEDLPAQDVPAEDLPDRAVVPYEATAPPRDVVYAELPGTRQ